VIFIHPLEMQTMTHNVSTLYLLRSPHGICKTVAGRSRPRLSWLASMTCACFLTYSPVASADWPEFRGPSQNGVTSNLNLPLEWSSEKGAEKNVVWFNETLGLGWSSPVIVGRKIYITSARNGNSSDGELSGPQSLHLTCYDADNGQQLFDRPIFEQDSDAPSIHKKNSHASPTLVAHEGRLYLHFGHQGTACTDPQGQILWTNRDHVYPPVHGNGGSPILVGDKLIVTCDGGEDPYTLALDTATGKEIWRTPRGVVCDRPFSFATPQLIDVQGQQQIISPGSDIVQSLDPATGQVLWSVSYSGFSVVPRPIYHQGLVFISTGYMAPKLLAIDPTGRGDVTESHLRWTHTAGVPNTPSMVPVGDQIVMVSDGGVASGIRASDGKKIWQKRLGGNFSASPLAVGNRVYFQSESGEVIVMEIGEEATEVARSTLPGRIFSSYAVIDDDLIIRSEEGLYRIGSR
jgi:outer membrane protein assembly factor BamB